MPTPSFIRIVHQFAKDQMQHDSTPLGVFEHDVPLGQLADVKPAIVIGADPATIIAAVAPVPQKMNSSPLYRPLEVIMA